MSRLIILSITIAIHAQPYNFRRVYFPGEMVSVHNSPGMLVFSYKWSSTDGSLADLLHETIHENVVAPSSPSLLYMGQVYYEPDDPPFNWLCLALEDIVVVPATATSGITDTNSYGDLGQSLASAFESPYKVDSFALTQTFKFNDPATMMGGAEQIIPGNAGPFTITNAVVADSGSPSKYSYNVTKDGVTSLNIHLP